MLLRDIIYIYKAFLFDRHMNVIYFFLYLTLFDFITAFNNEASYFRSHITTYWSGNENR